jgi:hypothetical protein
MLRRRACVAVVGTFQESTTAPVLFQLPDLVCRTIDILVETRVATLTARFSIAPKTEIWGVTSLGPKS